jgi:hypothetical protein
MFFVVRFGVSYYSNNYLTREFSNEFNATLNEIVKSIKGEDDIKKVVNIISSDENIQKIQQLDMILKKYEKRIKPIAIQGSKMKYEDLMYIVNAKDRVDNLTRDDKSKITMVIIMFEVLGGSSKNE